MIVHIPQVLTASEVAQFREKLETAQWSDGRATAGPLAAPVKANLQLPEGDPVARALGEQLIPILERNQFFISAALPRFIYPPVFNRYHGGMKYGAHVDNAIRQIPGIGMRIRTDVSATLFLSEPNAYTGGELVIQDAYGTHQVRLPAGDMVIYPASSLHQVNAVDAGTRLAAIFWVQSLVPDDAERTLLFELDRVFRELSPALPESPALIRLSQCYHNLLRRWAV